jgi:branched-chain amino acid aminotransferase
VTPCDGVLEGITRRTVLDICTALGIPAKARAISVDELRRADEIFVTSTAGGVMPVGWLDGQAIGEGSPGAITDRVAQTYWAWHGEARWSTPVRACLD